MRLTQLPQHTYQKDAPALPPLFVNPEAVSVVVDVTPPESSPVTQVVVGGSFFEIALSVDDVLRVVGATVTEVVFRDVTPSA